jgi:hypothetical protein
MTAVQYSSALIPYLTPAELSSAKAEVDHMRDQLAAGQPVDPAALADALAALSFRLASWRERQDRMSAPDAHTGDWKAGADLEAADRFHLRRLAVVGARGHAQRVRDGIRASLAREAVTGQ